METSSARKPPETEGLFLQTAHSREPHHLETFLQVRRSDEYHFFCHGLSFVDLAGAFERDLRNMQVLVFRIPPSVLNPNYWEPLTRDSEEMVRAKMMGIITREQDGRTHIWRSDQIPRTRLLRDGVEVEADLLLGFVLRVSGSGLIDLGRAASGRNEHFEWMALNPMPEGPLLDRTVMLAHDDLTQMRLSLSEERILFSSHDDHFTRVLFSERSMVRRALTGLVRGYVRNLTGQHLSRISDKVLDQIIDVIDGLGISSWPERDFVEKSRTYEIACHLGKTEWGVHLEPGDDPPAGDEKFLIYYDRVSGLWAAAT